MTKANESPSSTQTSPEPDWEVGARRTTKDGRLLALSPEPATTGERAVDVNAWIRRKTEGLAGFAAWQPVVWGPNLR